MTAVLQHCPASEVPPPRESIGCSVFAAGGDGGNDVVVVAREDDADRDLAVARAIGGVDRTGRIVEADFALNARTEGVGKSGSIDLGMLRGFGAFGEGIGGEDRKRVGRGHGSLWNTPCSRKTGPTARARAFRFQVAAESQRTLREAAETRRPASGDCTDWVRWPVILTVASPLLDFNLQFPITLWLARSTVTKSVRDCISEALPTWWKPIWSVDLSMVIRRYP